MRGKKREDKQRPTTFVTFSLMSVIAYLPELTANTKALKPIIPGHKAFLNMVFLRAIHVCVIIKAEAAFLLTRLPLNTKAKSGV